MTTINDSSCNALSTYQVTVEQVHDNEAFLNLAPRESIFGLEVHGYTKEQWDEEVSKNKDHFRKLMKSS